MEEIYKPKKYHHVNMTIDTHIISCPKKELIMIERIPAGKFKTHCLKIMDEVYHSHQKNYCHET